MPKTSIKRKPRTPPREDSFRPTSTEEDVPRKKRKRKRVIDDVRDTHSAKETERRKKKKRRIVDDEDDDDDIGDGEVETDDDDDPEPVQKPRKRKNGKTHVDVAIGRRRTIALESRELTKKAEASLQMWKGRTRGKTLDTFFARQAAEARKTFGHKAVYLGSETKNLVVGIPCPSLAFEFLIAQDCFPLGLVLQIVAKYGVGKSGLLAEIGRWFDLAGGGMVLCENETKFNPFWYESILGKEAYDRVQMHRCKSVEDWQKRLTWSMKKMKTDLLGSKEKPGPGRTVPVLFGVDSIMGKMSEEVQEKILGAAPKKKGGKDVRGTTGEGYAASRSYPVEAGSITKYMRTIPQELDEWPFALVLINHLRMTKDNAGNDQRTKSGGEQVNFQESFELEIKKVGGHKKKIESKDFEGFPVEITCEKNSFGPTHRKIQTRVLWWDEEDPNNSDEWIQKTVWDWDWSTVHLLDSLMHGERASPRYKAALKDIGFHLEVTERGDTANAAWSKSVGHESSQDAVSWTELGALIREEDELLDSLRKALRINRRPLLEGDYLKQKEKLVEDMP